MKRKLFCIGMCIALIITLIPSMAFAEEISAASAVQSGNGAEHIGHADMEIGAVATPDAQAANTSNAIARSIAVVNWDKNGQEQYDTSKITMQVCPGASTEYCVIGTGTGDAFQPMQEMPDTCTISAVKDGSGSVQTKNDPSEADPLYAGAVIAWYKQEEAALYIGYNQDAILLGTEAYGDYHIRITWTQSGNPYEASTTLTLQPAASLVRGIFRSGLENYEKENGFLRTWYTREQLDTNEEKQFRLTYAPYYDYQEKYTMLYSDEAHGILSFTGSNCDIEGLFIEGDAVPYKKGLEISPLLVDYSKISVGMIGKNYTLKFKSDTGEVVTCDVVVTLLNELDYLEGGQVYVVEDGRVKEDGRLYISNQDEAIQDLVKSEFAGQVKHELTSCFFGMWNEAASCFTPMNASCEDSNVTMRGSGKTGYNISAAQVTNGNFRSENGQVIPYTFSLPETGFYRMPNRTAANYLGDEIYLAEETVTDGHYRFYYMVQAKDPFQKGDLNITHAQMEGVIVSTTDDWTDPVNKQTYYVWEVQVGSQVSFDEDFWIELSGQKDGQEFDANDWITIHDADVVPESQQLYWFYDENVKAADNGKLQLQDGANGSLDRRANRQENWTERSGSISGYFAVKKGDDFYAQQNVQLTETEGVTLEISNPTTEPYLYTISWTNFGIYHFTAEAEKKEYRFVFHAALPVSGFYGTDTRSEDTYLDREFHYITATDKKTDGTEAFFYLIAPMYHHTAEQIHLSYGKLRWNEAQENTQWTELPLPSGISIGTPFIKTMDKQSYTVWKITVAHTYRTSANPFQQIKLSYGTAEEGSTFHIDIYDAAEIPAEQQLYQFESRDIKIDEQGKLQLCIDTDEYTLDNIARTHIYSNTRTSQTSSVYLAVKKGNDYYAVNNVKAKETENITLTLADNSSYLYTIAWTDFGEYQLTAEQDGKAYRFPVYVQLPEIGCYSRPVRTNDSYIDNELYFANAVEKNDAGTEAYFYLIAPTNGYDISQMKPTIMTETWDGETSQWIQNVVSGIAFGKAELQTFDGTQYAVWKATITTDYKGEGAYCQIEITCGTNNEKYGNISIRIYDATEILQSQQLYFFSRYVVTVDENGKLVPTDGKNILHDLSRKILYGNHDQEEDGYFAVRQGEDYYAVDSITTPEHVKISKYKYNPFYICKIMKIGEYEIQGNYRGSSYKMKAIYQMPYSGFYAKNQETAENYLYGQFYARDAAEKNDAGTESYFYFFRSTEEDGGNAEVYLKSDSREKGDTAGLKLEVISQVTKKDITYWTYKITVPSTYIAKKKHTETWRVTNGNWFIPIQIFDAEAISPKEQLYWFNNYSFVRNNQGVMEITEESGVDIDTWAQTEGDLIYKDKMRGYFAVLKEGAYHVVDHVSATEGVTVSYDEKTSLFTLSGTHVGEYTVTYVDGEKTCYFKSSTELAAKGFYSQKERTEANWLEAFMYDSHDNRNTIYYIASKEEMSHRLSTDNLTDVKASVISKQHNDIMDSDKVHLGEAGEITENGIDYWYWSIVIEKALRSKHMICLELSCGENQYATNGINITGYIRYGDVNDDDKVNYADVMHLKRAMAGWSAYHQFNFDAANVNEDQCFNYEDIYILERHIAGWKGYEKLPKVS